VICLDESVMARNDKGMETTIAVKGERKRLKAFDKNSDVIAVDTILNFLKLALRKLDWDYVTPSRRNYSGNHFVEREQEIWFERLFAYELYHQLRVIWDKTPLLRKQCAIQAEVRKKYQNIGLDAMPDLIFHLPNSKENFVVVEIKLIGRNLSQITRDLNKLLQIRDNRYLEYKCVVEILIGGRDSFDVALKKLHSPTGETIHIFHVCTDDRRIVAGVVKYKRVKRRKTKTRQLAMPAS
jgi:hypothetical protein